MTVRQPLWVRHILEQLLGLTLFTLPLSETTDSLISWSSKKASRVAKSALAAEIMAASEACDEGHWVRHILEQLLGSTLITADMLTKEGSSSQVERNKTRKIEESNSLLAKT